MDKPEGSLSALSNPAIQNPTFVADSEGTYLIKLTVNRTLATEASSKIIAAISQLKSGMRIPAAGESVEMSTLRGWALSTNRDLQLLDNLRADPQYVTGYAAGNFSGGDVLYISGVHTIKSGLPGEEKVLAFSNAYATSATSMDVPLFLFRSSISGASSVTMGNLFHARSSGVVGPFALGSGSVGDPIYVGNGGKVSLTAGDYPRRIGTLVAISGSDYYVAVDGHLGHHEGTVWMTGGGSVESRVTARDSDLILATADATKTASLENGSGNFLRLESTGDVSIDSGKIQGVALPSVNTDAANKQYVDTAVSGVSIVSKSTLYWGNGDTSAASNYVALDPGYNNRVAQSVLSTHPVLRAVMNGTLKYLYVSAYTGPTGGGLKFDVYVNGSATGITCTLAAGGTGAADTTNFVSVTAGDQIEIWIKQTSGTTVGALDCMVSLGFIVP